MESSKEVKIDHISMFNILSLNRDCSIEFVLFPFLLLPMLRLRVCSFSCGMLGFQKRKKKKLLHSFMNEVVAKAKALLNEQPNMPLKAFWQVLKVSTPERKAASLEAAMTIVVDPLCGLERRLTEDERATILYRLGSTPLMLAACAGRSDVVEALIAAGAEVDATDGKGTALLWACTDGDTHIDVVNVLLAHGADMNLREEETLCSSLHNATRMGSTKVLKLLLSYGADVDATDENGKSPLFEACHHARLDAVEVLIAHGANLDLRDVEGKTPLHWAANFHWSVHENVLEVLSKIMSEGLDPTVQDDYGQTPLDVHNRIPFSRNISNLYLQKVCQLLSSGPQTESNKQTEMEP